MKKVLFIVTSANKMGRKRTGIWYEELSTPYYIFFDEDYQVEIASPKGGPVFFDPTNFEETNSIPSVRRFQDDILASNKVQNTKMLSTLNFNDYDAIFFPGGHGAMVDLPKDKTIRKNLGRFFDSGKPVGAICHGVAAFVKVKRTNGKKLIKGFRLTCFSNTEEKIIKSHRKVPFLLQTKLTKLGGKFEAGINFESYVVKDRNLITGQNPASSLECAKVLLEATKNYKGKKHGSKN